MASNLDAPTHAETMTDFYWWGIPTLFRCEVEEDPSKVDIGLVGIPHSSGNGITERDQHLGPRALRDVSMEYRRIHREFDFSPWDACRVRDMADVPLPNAMHNDRTIKDIEAYFKRLDQAGTRPVSVGGDHSITLPVLRAIAGRGSHISGEPVAVVHFDAHHDSYGEGDVGEEYLGNIEWAGAWARIMCEENLVDPKKVFQIGIRGHKFAQDEGIYSKQAGYRIIEKAEFDTMGVAAVVEEIRNRIGDTPTYITFDLDALDPAVAPGVSNIEAGYPGMTMGQAMGVLQGMWGMNVIGGDVVCIMPSKDAPNKITAINASVILFEQICLIAASLAKQNESRP